MDAKKRTLQNLINLNIEKTLDLIYTAPCLPQVITDPQEALDQLYVCVVGSQKHQAYWKFDLYLISYSEQERVQHIKVKEQLPISELTNITMLSQNRVDLYKINQVVTLIMTNKETIKELVWVLSKVYQIQNSKELKLFDENRDDCSEALNSLATEQQWDQFHFLLAELDEDDDELQKLIQNRPTILRDDSISMLQNRHTVKVNKDNLNRILSSSKTIENYEEAFANFQKEINGELKDYRTSMLNELDEIQNEKTDLVVLERVNMSLSGFQTKSKAQKNKVQNLRGQIDEIESKNTRVVQEEVNYKKLYGELGKLLKHIKIDVNQQQFLIDVDLSNDGQLEQTIQYLENLKVSLEAKGVADLRFISDQHNALLKLQAKVTRRLIESILKQIRLLDTHEDYLQLINDDLEQFLTNRIPIMGLIAEIQAAQSKKFSQDISSLVNSFYQPISEEYSVYIQKFKFQELVKGFYQKVAATYYLDKAKQSKQGQIFQFVTKGLIQKTAMMSADEDMAEFCLKLLLAILKFEQVFFQFFECKNMQLIKKGDKGFNQFAEISLQDLHDQAHHLVEVAFSANPFFLYVMASVSMAIVESIQKSRAKQVLAKYVPLTKKVDFKEIKNLYYQNIFEKISNSARQQLSTFIENEIKVLEGLQINIRYAGILEPINKIIMVCEYMCALCQRLQHRLVGSKIINQVLLKRTSEWLTKVSETKPKYADLVMMENSHYISDCLSKMKQKNDQCDFMDYMINHFKQLYEEHSEKYIETIITYICKELKEDKPDSDLNKIYQRAFGNKAIGANFEKMVKRVHKHLTKEYSLYGAIIVKLKQGLQRQVDKAMKQHKVTTVSMEALDYFFSGEGNKIIEKYSAKK